MSSDGEKASAAWRRTLDGTERRVHHQEERGGDANLVDRAHCEACAAVDTHTSKAQYKDATKN